MNTWQILVGDVREKLRELPDQSVQVCVTSPPYWGLRDYGTATWDGGDPACSHAAPNEAGTNGNKGNSVSHPGRFVACVCGARRIDSQIGLEPTPDAFCEALVQVFREVRRVLKDDGTLWMNLGDSYLAQQGNGFNGQKRFDHANLNVKVARPDGIKPKDLAGIPWMVAFALRADGWYLRSDIIWHKPNPMPESVTDRPTKSHEYIFLLTKQARYYFDADAIKEEGVIDAGTRGAKGSAERHAAEGVNSRPPEYKVYDGFRNKRSVWTITTQPFPEAHFATYPEALVEPCILAGSKPGDTVLDPFNGSGTTGVVAVRHQRNYIGIELNDTYAEMARRRIGTASPLFAVEHQAAPAPRDGSLFDGDTA